MVEGPEAHKVDCRPEVSSTSTPTARDCDQQMLCEAQVTTKGHKGHQDTHLQPPLLEPCPRAGPATIAPCGC